MNLEELQIIEDDFEEQQRLDSIEDDGWEKVNRYNLEVGKVLEGIKI